MKSTDKKDTAYTYLGKAEEGKKQVKQTSGDKDFDKAIDKLLKPVKQPAK